MSVQDELSLQKVVIVPKNNEQLHTYGGQQLKKTVLVVKGGIYGS